MTTYWKETTEQDTATAAEDGQGQRKKRKRTLTSTFESVSQRERRAPVPTSNAFAVLAAAAVSSAAGCFKNASSSSSSSSSSSFVPHKSTSSTVHDIDTANYSQTLKSAADERKKQVRPNYIDYKSGGFTHLTLAIIQSNTKLINQ